MQPTLIKSSAISSILAALILTSVRAAEAMVLWYDQPATQWTEALPVGNGRMGAMIFGGLRRVSPQNNN
jgi:alpha-L-fucosidase 2